MAIDTIRTRMSAAWVGIIMPPSVYPDGDLNKTDRRTIAWAYAGLEGVIPPELISINLYINRFLSMTRYVKKVLNLDRYIDKSREVDIER